MDTAGASLSRQAVSKNMRRGEVIVISTIGNEKDY